MAVDDVQRLVGDRAAEAPQSIAGLRFGSFASSR